MGQGGMMPERPEMGLSGGVHVCESACPAPVLPRACCGKLQDGLQQQWLAASAACSHGVILGDPHWNSGCLLFCLSVPAFGV